MLPRQLQLQLQPHLLFEALFAILAFDHEWKSNHVMCRLDVRRNEDWLYTAYTAANLQFTRESLRIVVHSSCRSLANLPVLSRTGGIIPWAKSSVVSDGVVEVLWLWPRGKNRC